MTCHARWLKQTKTHTKNKNLQSFVLLFSISHCSRYKRFICEQNGQKSLPSWSFILAGGDRDKHKKINVKYKKGGYEMLTARRILDFWIGRPGEVSLRT